MTHPDPETLLGFVYGHLSSEPAGGVRTHLSGCGECSAGVSRIEEERFTLQSALAPPPLSAEELERNLSDILDSPTGGTVGPRSTRGRMRDPFHSAIARAVPIGVASGVFLFLLLAVLHEGTVPSRSGASPAPSRLPPVGTVTGTVRWRGESPPGRSIEAGDRCPAHRSREARSLEVLTTDGRLQNVLIYVKSGLEGAAFEPPSVPAVLTMQCWARGPHVLTAVVRQEIRFESLNCGCGAVHVMSRRNPPLNFVAPPGKPPRTFALSNPEIGIRMQCDAHLHHAGILHVLAHPYFDVTGADGSFRISGLPVGRKYVLAAWHERFGERLYHLTMGNDRGLLVDFDFESVPSDVEK